jgi:hypothetical protein
MDFYGHQNGIPFRVQADKPPDKETTAAIKKMVEVAFKMKIKSKTDNNHAKRNPLP